MVGSFVDLSKRRSSGLWGSWDVRSERLNMAGELKGGWRGGRGDKEDMVDHNDDDPYYNIVIETSPKTTRQARKWTGMCNVSTTKTTSAYATYSVSSTISPDQITPPHPISSPPAQGPIQTQLCNAAHQRTKKQPKQSG
jgi:hypothetical protein